jgi:hypothetical protein
VVRFLNQKAIIEPLRQKFAQDYQPRFAEFLEQAQAGVDYSTRGGALQAAVALVERFVKEVVLEFKVCDSAMGSGHFLVDAANQMSGLVVELLAALPDLGGLAPRITSDINSWRRLITRHCLYGVDLNPLAVDLAKLSLWLNGFAREHKLTFLDHHLRCGNSLIGLRSLGQLKTIPQRKKDKKKESHPSLPNFETLSLILAELAQESQALGALDEDETERQKAVLAEVQDTKAAKLLPVADLFTAYLMNAEIAPPTYLEIYRALMRGESESLRSNPFLAKIWKEVKFYRQRHQFFHWPLEFPEIFGPSGQGGFQANVGNPPWDVVKPNSQEFFSAYDPDFRRYHKQEANRVAARLMKDNEAIRRRWEDYNQFFAEQSLYVRESVAYEALGGGDINTYKLFLERFFTLLRTQGRLSILVPSGLYTDQGCLPLRRLFFNRSRIDFLYCYENRWPTVFPAVDSRFKFVVFGTEKVGKTEAFKCAFMEHDPERLADIDSNALKMQVSHVNKFSPDSLSLMEFKNQQDIDIASKIYDENLLIGQFLRDKCKTKFTREFDMTLDSHIFHSEEYIANKQELLPLWEGKQIGILTHSIAEPSYWISKEDTKSRPSTESTRFVYRAIGRNTDERTLITSVVPKLFPVGNSLIICPLKHNYAIIISAIFGSLVIDWIIRNKVSANLNMFIVEQIPIVNIDILDLKSHLEKKIGKSIIARACRLICTSEIFSGLWSECFSQEWELPDFWYPDSGRRINSYGPRHERDIRQKILEGAKNLSKKWDSLCGIHDRTPDRRDTGDRAQLRAEIDAYVAHLYGLSREDFAYILETFTVLRRNEEKAFGEYMSKRKCLEEFDRLATIL